MNDNASNRWVLSPEGVRSGARWLSGTGRDADVVISSRVRVARNIAGFPFVTRASREQKLEILERARGRLQSTDLGGGFAWVSVHEADELERTLMVERHLISREHARGPRGKNDGGPEPRAVAITPESERVSVMVNEEDHLRLQVIGSGLELSGAWEQASEVDDRLCCDQFAYAFDDRYGFLTACPTNVGTGIRVSVMLHLPALRLVGEMDKVRHAARDMNLALRGYYGEGSESVGEFFQLSNHCTLGKPETEIVQELERDIVPQVVEYERMARAHLMNKRRRLIEDKVFRALGVLLHARLLTPEESIAMLSDVRLGVLAGLIDTVPIADVNQLILQTQPAHLQRMLGVELDQGRRREARADFVRARLGG